MEVLTLYHLRVSGHRFKSLTIFRQRPNDFVPLQNQTLHGTADIILLNVIIIIDLTLIRLYLLS